MPFVRVEVRRAEALGLGRVKIIEVPVAEFLSGLDQAWINEVIRA